jgi:hypothetical protein
LMSLQRAGTDASPGSPGTMRLDLKWFVCIAGIQGFGCGIGGTGNTSTIRGQTHMSGMLQRMQHQH